MFIHWLRPRIPKTAIPARAFNYMIGLTHYYDVERKCRDCHRMFIFFAAEQKYWYETLLFPIETDCVRCYPCRKEHQRLARAKKKYDELYHEAERTMAQSLTMIECCLDLIESNQFSTKKFTWVRMMLRRMKKRFDKLNPSKKEEAAALEHQEKLILLQERARTLEMNLNCRKSR